MFHEKFEPVPCDAIRAAVTRLARLHPLWRVGTLQKGDKDQMGGFSSLLPSWILNKCVCSFLFKKEKKGTLKT